MLREVANYELSNDMCTELHDFACNYCHSDFSRIRFVTNGKAGPELKDINADFRDKVSMYVVTKDEVNFSSQLWCDLFVGQSKHDEVSWGSSEYLFLLGEGLLKVSGNQYYLEFLEGCFRSFDTYGACLSIRIDSTIVDELVKLLEVQLSKVVTVDDIERLQDRIEYVRNFVN